MRRKIGTHTEFFNHFPNNYFRNLWNSNAFKESARREESSQNLIRHSNILCNFTSFFLYKDCVANARRRTLFCQAIIFQRKPHIIRVRIHQIGFVAKVYVLFIYFDLLNQRIILFHFSLRLWESAKLLRQNNEGWWQMNVYGPLFDDVFLDSKQYETKRYNI